MARGQENEMGTRIELGPRTGREAFRGDLPLERDLAQPIVVDASALVECHPMLAVRLRLFVDWHLAAGHTVRLVGPADVRAAHYLADIGVGDGLSEDVINGLPDPVPDPVARLPIRRLGSWHDVEDASDATMAMVHEQAPALAVWGDPVHMAVSELCDNAHQHGKNPLGTYVVADRVVADMMAFRLAIADLGIGIPEHIRSRHPEWQDDTAAIVRALQRGVTGTGIQFVAMASPRSSKR